jgi:hypothetical protein
MEQMLYRATSSGFVMLKPGDIRRAAALWPISRP